MAKKYSYHYKIVQYRLGEGRDELKIDVIADSNRINDFGGYKSFDEAHELGTNLMKSMRPRDLQVQVYPTEYYRPRYEIRNTKRRFFNIFLVVLALIGGFVLYRINSPEWDLFPTCLSFVLIVIGWFTINGVVYSILLDD